MLQVGERNQPIFRKHDRGDQRSWKAQPPPVLARIEANLGYQDGAP